MSPIQYYELRNCVRNCNVVLTVSNIYVIIFFYYVQYKVGQLIHIIYKVMPWICILYADLILLMFEEIHWNYEYAHVGQVEEDVWSTIVYLLNKTNNIFIVIISFFYRLLFCGRRKTLTCIIVNSAKYTFKRTKLIESVKTNAKLSSRSNWFGRY